MHPPQHESANTGTAHGAGKTGDARAARRALIAAALAGLTAFLVFSPSIGYDFLRYDDEIYVTSNPHLRPFTPAAVAAMFTHFYFRSYTPLTLVSHAFDAVIWGDDPRGHHLTNVLLHAVNTGLVLLLAFLLISSAVRRGGGEADLRAGLWGGTLAALLFALHPLRVESVVWISGRKDLLMGLFVFSSMLAYTWYALQKSNSRAVVWRRLALVLYVLAVLAKSAALTLPFAMLGIDLALRREPWTNVPRLLREKAAFFAAMLLTAGSALYASGGLSRHHAIGEYGAAEMLMLPLYSPAFFVSKLLWPHPLTTVYPAPDAGVLALGAVTTLLVTVALLLTAFRKQRILPLVAWATSLLLLGPVLAGVNAGIQPWADRYTYVPLVGVIILAGGWFGALRSRLWGRPGGALTAAVAVVLLAGSTALTVARMPDWRDSVTLWKHAQAHSPESGPLILIPLGIAYVHAGQPDSAIALYRRSVALEPGYTQAYFAMGEAFAAKGETGTAAEAYLETLRRDSTHTGARNNLAGIYLGIGRIPEALTLYRRLVAAEPENARFRNNLGFALMRNGEMHSAATELRSAIERAPTFKSPYVNLGVLYQNTGRVAMALEVLQNAAAIDPGDPNINYNLAIALESNGKFREAEEAYRRALASDQRLTGAWINLGNLLARVGRLQEARELFEQAAAATPGSAELCLNLAGVHNALGDPDGAFRALQEAVKRKPDFAPAYYAMGLFYTGTGDTSAARKSFQIASRYGSREADARLASPSRRRDR